MKILIDNGHGQETKGKQSPDGLLKEYKWAREMAVLLENELKRQGYDVERIVKEESDVPLATRVARVNNICKQLGSKNVLLVSIHNNASNNPGWDKASGFEVYVSKNSSSNSKKLASIFTQEAIGMRLMGNRCVPANKYWTWSWTTADIYILKATNCPAVLTENLFQNNKAEVSFLLSEAGKKKILDLHVNAIKKYVNSL